MEKEETMVSTVNEEIKKILVTDKEKNEYKRNKEFILQNFIEKNIK